MAFRSRAGRTNAAADPLIMLGLPAEASRADIDEARRRLARTAHPDVGGSVAAMQAINAAADAALRRIDRRVDDDPTPSPGTRRPQPAPTGRSWVDHPSFTIEALPAESFEALVVVAGWLGEVVDDDPPYALDVVLAAPLTGWCRLALVPDAGASTVSIAVAGLEGDPAPPIDAVRDAWVDALNQLDWS